MSLDTTLADIIARLRQGRFPNEQAVAQDIVLRVLQELGWDIYDTTLVWPEFQSGEGRADFAMCNPPSNSAELIEVKARWNIEDAVVIHGSY
jgi:predicted type IV restriction endonuclease